MIPSKNTIIGAIHFPPLPGYPDFPGTERAAKDALADLASFQDNGVDAVIIENNYDVPHTENISPEVKDAMINLGKIVVEASRVPVGVSVLWNDYKSAFDIAKAIGATFIRVPVFVDTVKTSYGTIAPNPSDVTSYRSRVGADNVAIYADIHVKHAEILSQYTIAESAKLAIKQGADVLIVTGKWTGDAPNIDDLKMVREAVGDFPIVCGSGVDTDNAKALFQYSNGAIVSTALKQGDVDATEVNIKSWDKRIDPLKVSHFIRAFKDK